MIIDELQDETRTEVQIIKDTTAIPLELIFKTFLKIFLIGSMVFFWPSMTAYAPQEMFVQYSIFILMAFTFVIPAKREISNIYIFLFFGYLFLITMFRHFQDISRYALMNIFLGVLAVKLLAERITFDFKKLGYLFLCYVAFNYFLISLQLLNRDPIFSSVNPQNMPQVDHVGFMGIRYALGVMAAFMLPFVFSITPWHSLFLIPCLYFSKSSTAVAAALFSFLFLLWFRHRRLFYVISGLVMIAAIYYIVFLDAPTGQFSKRLQVWWAGIFLAKNEPWFGHGLGTWAIKNIATVQDNGQPEKWMWAHNEFIQFLYETGVCGLIFLYAYFKAFCVQITQFLKSDERARIIFASFIALCIVSFFHFPFHVGKFAGMSIYILALMEAYLAESKKEQMALVG